jgi:glycosyltransferase involved in cell wall biosynthesis
VPDILYHRWAPDGASARAEEAARGALRNHLKETGRDGAVEPGPQAGLHHVRFAVRGAPSVSIIIPSACRPVRVRGESTYYLLKCLESIEKSTWGRREIIVLHGPEVPPSLARRLDQGDAVRARYAAPFNWARAMNQGAALARGEHLLFLNDDVDVINPDWLDRMLEFSQQPAVGAVGAKLLFPGGGLQHAGVAVLGGKPVHPFYSHPGDDPGYFKGLLAPRNCSAVTGACLMTRADVFRAAGGFDEAFPLNYNDVDYCLRLRGGGRRVVWTPHARLYHHELGTRPPEVRPEERDAFLRRWGAVTDDPYYNPNLSTEHLDYRIRPVEGINR